MKKDKEELRKELTPIQYSVTQEDATEKPYENEYWDNTEEGIYVDIVSGVVLFSSKNQYDAQCGWPSFTKPVDKSEVEEKEDRTAGMLRTEIRSTEADSHLGHVFEDGPEEEGGLRYCMNSAAMRFIARDKMEDEGYENYTYLFND